LAKYASTNAANNIYTISPQIAPLVQFNTVLAHQGQPSGILDMWHRVKGGAVDEGLPIRTKAKELMDLLADVKEFREMRRRCASEHSLVPVGDKEKAGFVTDHLRLEILKDKIEKEKRLQTQSNLKMSVDGFGSGYNSKKGDTVVGAAHGMEDMLKLALKGKNRYTDGGLSKEEMEHFKHLEMLQEDMKRQQGKVNIENTNNVAAQSVDLLDFGNSHHASGNMMKTTITSVPAVPYPENYTDEDDFTTEVEKFPEIIKNDISPSIPPQITGLPTPKENNDLLGFHVAESIDNKAGGGDLLDLMSGVSISSSSVMHQTISTGPFAPMTAAFNTNSQPHDPFDCMSNTPLPSDLNNVMITTPLGGISSAPKVALHSNWGSVSESVNLPMSTTSVHTQLPSVQMPPPVQMPSTAPPPLPDMPFSTPPPPPSFGQLEEPILNNENFIPMGGEAAPSSMNTEFELMKQASVNSSNMQFNMMNPQMMQPDLNKMSSDEKNQYLQQMMLMNQQMMAQVMQMNANSPSNLPQMNEEQKTSYHTDLNPFST
jgi:hypothetical protein